MRVASIAAIILWPLLLLAQAGPAPAGPMAVDPVREALAFTFPEGAELRLQMTPTPALSTLTGEARVERERGVTRIDVDLRGLRQAENFGPDFQTYVLWAVSPEGIVQNLGELPLRNDRSRLRTATPLQTFALFVTAEPYYLVEQPSPLVVASMDEAAKASAGQYRVVSAPYTASTTPYRIERQAIGDTPEYRGEVIVNPKQAELAIQIAKRGLAAQYSQPELERAEAAFRTLLASLRTPEPDRQAIGVQLHDAVRWVAQAERLARPRSAEAQFDAKHRAYETEFRRAEAAEAELAAIRDRLQHTETELARTREILDKTQAALQLALREKEEALNLMVQADRARDQLEEATMKLRAAQEDYRSRFRAALARVVEVNETDRGIVVRLPDVAFDKGKTTLLPSAKEILSRLVGVLMVAAKYRLSVEGHTDSTGTAKKNQEVSLERAQNVAEYLVDSGVAQDLITIEGYGQSRPIADNSTPDGRAQNRRVEIVILELSVN